MSRSLFLLAACAAVLCRAEEYRFTAAGGSQVHLEVSFLKPYAGTRLVFYTEGRESCFSAETGFAKCPESFVGAAALVQYKVAAKKRQKPREVRESVVVLAQSPELPPRAQFGKTVRLVGGRASDVQLFGYEEEADLGEAERRQERESAKRLYRRFRQELFLDGEAHPFAVLEWVHTISGIRLERVESW